jgi:TPR repeat protein
MKKLLGFSVLALAAFTGCPDPKLPDPPQPTPGPKVIEGTGEPLIVDWQPQHRGDLEVAMQDGLAVVEYSDKGFRLLKGCRVDGTYGFIGMSTKEQIVRLESADDVKANLPFGGAALVGQIGADLGRSTTLDVAMVMVGKLRTTWNNVTQKDLVGNCAGATHFVKGAMVGAFVMDTGDKSHARAVAEFFSIGASGGGRRESKIRNADGKLEECNQALPDSKKAPAKCSALLRVELLEITKDAVKPKAEERTAALPSCPAGMALIGGKCTRPSTVTASAGPRECVYGNAAQCADLCDKGSAVSCGRLGLQLLRGENIKQNPDLGAKATLQGCKLNDGPSCEYLGDFLASTMGGKPNMASAAQAWVRGCELGRERACTMAGDTYYTANGVKQDYGLAAKLLDRGCMGGDHNACSELGIMFLGNAGVGTDVSRSGRLFKSACDGGSSAGCTNLGYLVEFGKATTKNPQLAAQLYAKGCKLDDASCASLAQATHAGIGVPKSIENAEKLFRIACRAHDVSSCAVLRVFADPSTVVNPVDAKRNFEVWKGTCSSGIERDCTGIGVIGMATGSISEGRNFVQKGCSMGDAWACELLKLQVKVN